MGQPDYSKLEQKGGTLELEPNWSLAELQKCEECGHDVFISGVYLQKLSKIAAGTNKDVVRPVPTFACSKCGHVNSDLQIKH